MERHDENAVKVMHTYLDRMVTAARLDAEMANKMRLAAQSTAGTTRSSVSATMVPLIVAERDAAAYEMQCLMAWHERGEDPVLWKLANPKAF